MHGKRRSVLALTGYNTSNADDMSLARGQIPGQITVVARTIRGWHQHTDVLADGFGFGVSELPFGGAAEELHDAAPIDDNHGIGDSLQDPAKLTFPHSKSFFGLLLIVDIDYDPA